MHATAARALLGVDSHADAAAIRAAFRRRVRSAHPDTGGSADEFRRLLAAQRVALEVVRSMPRTRRRTQRPPRFEGSLRVEERFEGSTWCDLPDRRPATARSTLRSEDRSFGAVLAETMAAAAA